VVLWANILHLMVHRKAWPCQPHQPT